MQYKMLFKIGDGGLADVFRVQDDNGDQWALKELKATITDPKLIARFRQEIRIQAMLKHAGIVSVIAASPNADRPFYIMPCADKNLESQMPAFAKDPGSFAPIAQQLLDALEYAHTQRILHRDIKPRNVLLFQDRAMFADFGLGKSLDWEASYTTTTSDTWGTFWYAPPEQRKGLANCDARSDIFSLGKLFLECLCGYQPNELPVTLDGRWQYVIRRCIRDNPADRWQSVADLHRQFKLVFGIEESQVIDPEDILGKIGGIAQQTSAISTEQLGEIQAIVARIIDDEVLVRRVFDKLPPNLVAAWAGADPDGFSRFVRTYDDSLGEYITFEYCDVIADQYAMIHGLSNDAELRALLRKRLFSLGPTHNRWHVGRTFGGVLGTVREPADIAQILELIEAKPDHAAWNQPYCCDARIDKRIRSAVKGSE